MGQLPKIVGWCAVALVGFLALSWRVGLAGPGEGFDWELASVFGTALGTTLLALATGALALLTYREVTATQELAELTRNDQLMRDRPLVLARVTSYQPAAAPGTPSGDESRGWLTVELWNVGLGPAARIELGVTYDREPGPSPEIASVILTAIPPGATATPGLEVLWSSRPTGRKVTASDFTPTGAYLDRSLGRAQQIIPSSEAGQDGHQGPGSPGS